MLARLAQQYSDEGALAGAVRTGNQQEEIAELDQVTQQVEPLRERGGRDEDAVDARRECRDELPGTVAGRVHRALRWPRRA